MLPLLYIHRNVIINISLFFLSFFFAHEKVIFIKFTVKFTKRVSLNVELQLHSFKVILYLSLAYGRYMYNPNSPLFFNQPNLVYHYQSAFTLATPCAVKRSQSLKPLVNNGGDRVDVKLWQQQSWENKDGGGWGAVKQMTSLLQSCKNPQFDFTQNHRFPVPVAAEMLSYSF